MLNLFMRITSQLHIVFYFVVLNFLGNLKFLLRFCDENFVILLGSMVKRFSLPSYSSNLVNYFRFI